MTITLNNDQQAAYDAIFQFLDSGDSEFVMAGLAGTGKTTLVCEILRVLSQQGRTIAVVAPTGKAAKVLNSKQTYFRATTIHRLLYKQPNDALAAILTRLDQVHHQRDIVAADPTRVGTSMVIRNRDAVAQVARMKKSALEKGQDAYEALMNSDTWASAVKACDKVVVLSSVEACDKLIDELMRQQHEIMRSNGDKLTFVLREPEEIEENYEAIFVDESSMVGEDIVRDLRALGIPLIFLGDPNQLLPVKQDKFSVPLDKPDVKLSEIMRQAGDSPVLRLSREILKQRKMPLAAPGVEYYRGTNPLPLIEKYGLDTQFIAYKNDTRRYISRIIRNTRVSDFHPQYRYLPVIGEQLMIDANAPDKGLMKGDIVTVEDIVSDKYALKDAVYRSDYLYRVIVADDNGVRTEIVIHLNDLMLTENHARGIDERYGRRTDEDHKNWRHVAGAFYDGIRVQFPYAITCHKSQGSEWKSVVVYSDIWGSDTVPYYYTAVTRARENVVIAAAPKV